MASGVDLHVDDNCDDELPILEHRKRILRHIRDYKVTCIHGETGCGKSTMVPQFILEYHEQRMRRAIHSRKPLSADDYVNIIVTQPRRMAAISLAKRVANQRGEDVGDVVGYKIGGDSSHSEDTRICYVTTGLLLQVLTNSPECFKKFSHVILDEIHERQIDSDLLSLIVKMLANDQECFRVKVVIMSATLEGELFSRYFSRKFQNSGCSSGEDEESRDFAKDVIFVGAKRYNVSEFYLDDLIRQDEYKGALGASGLRAASIACVRFNRQMPLGAGIGKKTVKKSEIEKLMKQNYANFQSKGVELHIEALSELESMKKGLTARFPMKPDICYGLEQVCIQLILHLLRPGETILVFLPGVGEIQMLYDDLVVLEGNPFVCCRFQLFTLSSRIFKEEQIKIADTVPSEDEAHIILATNIAENSLTLPKVRHVIDFGLRRHLVYVPERSMECLMKTWISQASADQRKGRTGRVFEGTVFRLYTRYFYEHCMLKFDKPEMQVAALDKLILQAKQVGSKVVEGIGPTKLLSMAISPPDPENIVDAIVSLADAGALTAANENADMTLLALLDLYLPLDLKLCRLVFFGTIFNCVADVVVMAAAMSLSQDVFNMPTQMVQKNPKDFSESLRWSSRSRCLFDGGEYSEPIMVLNMFKKWIIFRCNFFRKRMNMLNQGRKSYSSIQNVVEHAWSQFKKHYAVNEKRLIDMESTVIGIATRLQKFLPSYCAAAKKLKALTEILKADGGISQQDQRATLGQRREKQNYVSDGNYNDTWMFVDDPKLLKLVLTAALTPNFLCGTPDGNIKSRNGIRTEEQLQEANFKLECSVILPDVPSRLMQEPKLCKEVLDKMFPSKSLAKHKIQHKGQMFLEFPENPDQRHHVIQDITWSAHHVNQFGEGREKFPCPGLSQNEGASGVPRFSRPTHPYKIRWRYKAQMELGGLFFSVEGIPSGWRNPIGFACERRTDVTHYAIAAEVQGGEDPKKCHLSGVTVLPSDCDGLLAITGILMFLPSRYALSATGQYFPKDKDSYTISSVKIVNQDIALSEKHTLTPKILHLLNAVRREMSALLSNSEDGYIIPDVNLQPLLNRLVTHIINGEHRKETKQSTGASQEKKPESMKKVTLDICAGVQVTCPFSRDSLCSSDSEDSDLDEIVGEEIPDEFSYYKEYNIEEWFPYSSLNKCEQNLGENNPCLPDDEKPLTKSEENDLGTKPYCSSDTSSFLSDKKSEKTLMRQLCATGSSLQAMSKFHLVEKAYTRVMCPEDGTRVVQHMTDEPLFEDPWD